MHLTGKTLRLLLLLLAVLGAAKIVASLPGRWGREDFSHYYATSRMLLSGENPYTQPLKPFFERHGFVFDPGINHGTNPPALAWLLAPLARLSPAGAFAWWEIIQACSLLAVFLLTYRLLAPRLSPDLFLTACCVSLYTSPVQLHFYTGQTQLLLLALILLADALLRADRRAAAIGLVTATALLKLFPLVLVPWFLWRIPGQMRDRLPYLLEAGLVAGLVLWATGPELWLDFTRQGLRTILEYAVNRQSNYSLPSLVLNLAYAAGAGGPVAGLAPVWMDAAKLLGVAVPLGTYGLLWRGRFAPEVALSLLLLAMLVGGVTCWGHYLVLLFVPVMVALADARVRRPGAYRIWLLAIVAVLCTAGLEHHLTGLGPVAVVWCSYAPLYAMLALAALLVRLGATAAKA